MRNKTNIEFSLVIPSRGRFQHLTKCIDSFINKAKFPDLIEIIVLLDYDDKQTLGSGWTDFAQNSKVNIKTVLQKRSSHKIRDYDNFGSQCTTGKYIWILNDDVTCVTKNWDSKIKYNMEKFIENNKDRICYVKVNDKGPCFMFPIVTKETIDTIGMLFPEEISGAFADTWLHIIFENLEEKRILELNDIEIQPEVLYDETAVNMKNISNCLIISEEEFKYYIKLLNDKIRMMKMIKEDYYDQTLKMLEFWVENYGVNYE